MKKFLTFSCGLAALLMTSCSSDEPMPTPGGEAGQNDVFANLTLNFPSGTRATDEDGNYKPDGIEVGQEDENFVSRVLVVLATQDKDGQYKFLTKAVSDVMESSSTTENTIKYVLNFSSAALDPTALGENSPVPNSKVYVFAYCNPTQALITASDNWAVGSNFVDAIGNIENLQETTIWKAKNFLMTNCEISDATTIPSRDELVKLHNTPENAFNLGQVAVKRVAARFDFQTTETEAGVNKYTIFDVDGKTPMGVVELTDMAMFNISKSFYYMPRASQEWTWTNPELCKDTDNSSYRYMVSTNQSLKQSPFTGVTFDNYYFYPISSVLDSGRWTSIRDWNNREDDDNNWSRPDEKEHDYRIWRYATENTIPAYGGVAGDVRSQRAGITTGVVFRGEFTPADTEVWNGNAVYTYNNLVFGDFDALKKYVTEYPESQVALDFKKVDEFVNVRPGHNHHDRLIPVTGAGKFKAFEATKTVGENGEEVWKYMMYYFYYNRHNTNGINTTMGVNEFGVVRNNVYKLSVNMVRSLGRPDTPDPDDEDEKENAYFTVSCVVMPWTVRVNDIDF